MSTRRGGGRRPTAEPMPDPRSDSSTKPQWVRGAPQVDAVFAENLASARAAAPDAPDLLVPVTSHTLFTPVEPFMTQSQMKLPVGRQQMEVLHISDYQRAEEALRGRSESGPLTQAFEPKLLRLVRRRLGYGHVNKGGPWMFDEPALSDVRRLISAPFKPSEARLLTDDISRTCEKVLQEMLDSNSRVLDVGTYSNEVHFRMMARIMGVDESLAPTFRDWMRVFNESHSLAALKPQPSIRRRLGALIAQTESAQRAGAVPVGLLGQLAHERLGGARIGPWRLRKSDVVSLLWAVIAAGTDTPGTAATAAVFFTLQTDEFRLLTEYDDARHALAESLRFYPPFPKPLMQVERDCTIGGVSLRKNQWVEVHLPAANRDGHMFSRPHEFDVDRADAKYARPFGDVPHYCIGSHYGQMVGAQVIVALATAVPKLALLPEPRPYRRHTGLLHRFDSLLVDTNL
jgi:cytochrome P450